MKRLVFIAAFVLSAGLCGAQNMYDAMRFSQNNYTGTARTLGMGNAVTAVGGDLGSIGINPAGSAVARYGQFTLTGGLSISATGSSFSPEGDLSYGPVARNSRVRGALPNVGVSMVLETGRKVGMKRMTFAVVANRTDTYNVKTDVSGINSRSSKVAELANGAFGYDESALSRYSSFDNSDISWDLLTAYQGGMFGGFGVPGEYVGVTETISSDGKYHYLSGPLHQTSYTSQIGSKTDVILNFGADFNDNLFLGVNLGLPFGNYEYTDSFYENPVNKDEFPISFVEKDRIVDTYFRSATFDYRYVASMRGVYLKLGAIYMPTRNLRVGLAFQTPTAMTVSETWQYGAYSSFDNSGYNATSTSPVGDYSYMLRTPYIANVGVAYTFGQLGLLSVDYEFSDFSIMKFSELGRRNYSITSGSNPFTALNETNKLFAGGSHKLRIGAEFKPVPLISLRAGFNLTTTPEKHWTNNEGEDVTSSDYMSDYEYYKGRTLTLVSSKFYKDNTYAFTLGAGYSSPRSFYADFAVRFSKYPTTTYSPYYDYNGCDKLGYEEYLTSARIKSSIGLWDAHITLGWRF